MSALDLIPPSGRQITRRELAAIRDIPAHCTCRWTYQLRPSRYVRDVAATGCPWHATRGIRT